MFWYVEIFVPLLSNLFVILIISVNCLCFTLSEHNIEELPPLVNELFSVGKHFLFLQHSLASKIGGLYLLYALYFTQLTRYLISVK